MSRPIEAFKFLVSERVNHRDAPDSSTFIITRRWLDVDTPEGQNGRYYELREETPLFAHSHQLRLAAECEIILAP